jgi:hypothetical protein
VELCHKLIRYSDLLSTVRNYQPYYKHQQPAGVTLNLLRSVTQPMISPKSELELDQLLTLPNAGGLAFARHLHEDTIVLGVGGKMGPLG